MRKKSDKQHSITRQWSIALVVAVVTFSAVSNLGGPVVAFVAAISKDLKQTYAFI